MARQKALLQLCFATTAPDSSAPAHRGSGLQAVLRGAGSVRSIPASVETAPISKSAASPLELAKASMSILESVWRLVSESLLALPPQLALEMEFGSPSVFGLGKALALTLASRSELRSVSKTALDWVSIALEIEMGSASVKFPIRAWEAAAALESRLVFLWV